jgi:hypothetical protein
MLLQTEYAAIIFCGSGLIPFAGQKIKGTGGLLPCPGA